MHRMIVSRLSSFGIAAAALLLPAAAVAEVAGPLVAMPVEAPDPVLTVTVMPDNDAESVATVTLSPTPSVPAESPVALPSLAIPTLADALPSALKVTAKPRLRPKAKLAKAKRLQPLLLSRTARQQMALFAARTDDPGHARISGNEDIDVGIDTLDLQVFYGRPKLVKESAQDDGDDDAAISDAVRLRLFLARMKAVEAHAMAQAAKDDGDEAGLSDKVTERLALARMAALEAHRRKFS